MIEDRLFDGRAWADIAAREGVSVKTVQTDLAQAIAVLRAMFARRLEGGSR